MASKGDKSLLFSVILICVVVGVGIAAYVKLAPADKVPREIQSVEQEGGGGVSILTPYYVDDELRFRQEDAVVPANVDPKVFAVNRYLRTAKPVPAEAELLTCTIDNGIATLNFNAPFEKTYATFDESTIVNGILATMGQFPEVSFVKFLVEGKTLETLGNLDLIDPLEVVRLPEVSQKTEGAQEPAKT